MDLFTFILFMTAIIGFMSILVVFLIVFGVRPQTKKLIEESKKLQLKMNQLKYEFGQYGGSSENLVKGALTDIGVDGILDQLGIDPSILKNPMVKGIIDKYAPRLIEQLSKGKNGSKEDIPLL